MGSCGSSEKPRQPQGSTATRAVRAERESAQTAVEREAPKAEKVMVPDPAPVAELLKLLGHLDHSVLQVPEDSPMGRQDTVHQECSILPPGTEGMWELLDKLTEDAGCNAAVGALVGLVVGDAVGHPLEFVNVDGGLPPYHSGRPHLRGAGAGGLEYEKPYNKFKLKEGQWTDDASMALCLADSLLARRGYHGGDARVRWVMWWSGGYNNAFRHDTKKGGTSVGLGGNICNSLCELDNLSGKSAEDVPFTYGSRAQDAGNGSIMRLAPVPIHYYKWPALGEAVADLQSKATHPGPHAAVCCVFMTF
eukprot:Hpha_TRINITY_DN15961_c0_g4::TRINITY_DN15961_c0_g4_i1::g.71051::m.71051